MPKIKYKTISRLTDRYVLGTYNRLPVAFKSGKGSWLTTVEDKKILDFFPGWGVSNLGHCHPRVVKAIREQSRKIIHLANVFHIPEQSQLAYALVQKAFPGKVFFSNSGAESVECALKAAKSYGQSSGKREIIAFRQSFHGRTTGAVTLTGQTAYRKPFRPPS